MSKLNRLSRTIAKVKGAGLPKPIQQSAISFLFNSQVKMALTMGIHISDWTNSRAHVELKNRWRVQNHIGGVHACGMALLAESASGMVFGMNVPDSHIPLIKSMTIRYKRLAKGDLQAVATLTPEQVR
jgi:acyl-coenzyme A thioesterase PaaI-like protein